LTHLSTTCQDGAEKDFQPFIETFFKDSKDSEDESKPTILFTSFFEVPSSAKCENAAENQEGPIYTCSGPFMELDYDESIRQTILLYGKMYLGDEFLPKAPEPEEIIIGDEDGTEGGVNLGALADLVEDEVKSGSESVEKTEQVSEDTEEKTEA
jgi:Rab proteins geranylgeranyltransferase component A